MPSLSQLEYIVAVDRFRHFGKAADFCHVTQPTLSMQIQKVEEEIGYPIFDRMKKPIVPTAKGTRLIQQAKILLREHQKLIEISKNQTDEVSGEFRLGVIPTIAPYLIPHFIETFSKEFPKVQLSIDELKTGTILQRLSDDTLDAAIMATPLHEVGLKERRLFVEPFYLYVSKHHPLNSRKRIKEEDLEGSQMWLLEDGHCFRSQIVHYCSLHEKDRVFPNIQFEGGNLDTLRYLVRKSQGYTLVPALLVDNLSESEKRDYVREFERPNPSREVSLVHRRDQWKSDILKALEETILKKLPRELLEYDSKRQQILEVK